MGAERWMRAAVLALGCVLATTFAQAPAGGVPVPAATPDPPVSARRFDRPPRPGARGQAEREPAATGRRREPTGCGRQRRGRGRGPVRARRRHARAVRAVARDQPEPLPEAQLRSAPRPRAGRAGREHPEPARGASVGTGAHARGARAARARESRQAQLRHRRARHVEPARRRHVSARSPRPRSCWCRTRARKPRCSRCCRGRCRWS